MPMFLAVCFLFLFCGHHHHHRHVSHHAPVPSCHNTITSDWEDFKYSWGQGYGTDVHQDQFVKRYPAAEQRAVLKCIDKAG